MNFSIRKCKAVFIKDLKEYYRSPAILAVLIMPIFYCLLYMTIFANDTNIKFGTFLINFCVDTNVLLPSMTIPTQFICEEKEKKTLDVLILSSVSPSEFLVGKLSPIILLSIISNIIIFSIINISSTYIVPFLVITMITTLSFIIIGSIIGFVCNTPSQATMYLMPIITVLFFIPPMSLFSKTVEKFSHILGISQMNIIVQNIISGKGLFYSKISLFVILIWILIPFTIFSYIYKHKKLY
ncbi:ABC transporter permease [Clostridium pasteurianum]|uniref:ABC transporter permease n=1 Tax=Clostridium pasteurianum TaxID=1501 RepID=UPI002260BD51|nr:ABC transporter permease [Clostridium pasteurianum]UZW14453.1 ABC transporter permease [Clostridium pasteurianum]